MQVSVNKGLLISNESFTVDVRDPVGLTYSEYCLVQFRDP